MSSRPLSAPASSHPPSPTPVGFPLISTLESFGLVRFDRHNYRNRRCPVPPPAAAPPAPAAAAPAPAPPGGLSLLFLFHIRIFSLKTLPGWENI
mmetsp:Transcript_32611/g.63869  ORF Transcript_32611/g.63869 Transcript_32611/m.63869 type:complete len:94 (-) Transcript_32611:1679-1960(-)